MKQPTFVAMKKVLIISYYWPPSGGIGVLRNLKFVKHLRQNGWEPIVYAPENAQYPYLDHSNDKDIPEGLRVLKQPIIEPHNLFKKLSGKAKDAKLNNPVDVKDSEQGFMDKLGIWVRGNFFIPDARFLWIKPSVRFLKKYIKEHAVDMLFTDGPPHTNTRIGTLLRKELDIPWVADFQDPWSQVDYLQRFKLGPRAWKIHKRMEQEAFAYADAITIASPTWSKDLSAIGAPPSTCLFYGFDEADFENIIPQRDEKLTIVHAGLMGDDRTPDGLFKALAQLKKEQHPIADCLQLKFIGQVDHSITNLAQSLGIASMLQTPGTMPRAQVLQEICNAQVLLLPINKADNAAGRIPAKIFEYLRTGRPILAFGPQRSDIGDIIRKESAGFITAYDDVQSIKDILKNWYDRYLNHTLELPPNRNIEEYTNAFITKKLAAILDNTWSKHALK